MFPLALMSRPPRDSVNGARFFLDYSSGVCGVQVVSIIFWFTFYITVVKGLFSYYRTPPRYGRGAQDWSDVPHDAACVLSSQGGPAAGCGPRELACGSSRVWRSYI